MEETLDSSLRQLEIRSAHLFCEGERFAHAYAIMFEMDELRT